MEKIASFKVNHELLKKKKRVISQKRNYNLILISSALEPSS